jgi:hypothetical protein
MQSHEDLEFQKFEERALKASTCWKSSSFQSTQDSMNLLLLDPLDSP